QAALSRSRRRRSAFRFFSSDRASCKAVDRMKRIWALTTVLLIGNGAIVFAAQPARYDAKVWRAVRTYDLATLSKELDAHARELVGVKCSMRGKDIHHMKPNWYESSIWQPLPGQSGKFAHVSVMVAKPDL